MVPAEVASSKYRVMGPPAPAWVVWLARAAMIALVTVVGNWVHGLGGVQLSPVPDGKGGNDTGRLFNWHPILMTLAFGVFMAEALLAYQSPIVPGLLRPMRKRLHYSLHMVALSLIVLGVTAAYKSHSLKLPTPIPHFYSPHSFLGLATLVLFGVQFALGLGSYLWPGTSQAARTALGPLHKFGGKATWICGLAAMATGLQEKTTFVASGRALAGEGLYSAVVRLPAVAELLIVILAMCVLFHQVQAAKAQSDVDNGQEAQGLLTSDP